MFGGNTAWKGILIGVGVSAVGFYAYKKNEDKVDGFLRRHGMDIYYSDYELEDLIRRSYQRLSGSADGGGRDGAPARLTDGGDGVRFRVVDDPAELLRICNMRKVVIRKPERLCRQILKFLHHEASSFQTARSFFRLRESFWSTVFGFSPSAAAISLLDCPK